jgi:antitoxin component YwqK of YwqJK toxin-antitoxin module
MKYVMLLVLFFSLDAVTAEDIPMGLQAFPRAVSEKEYTAAHNQLLTDYFDAQGERVGCIEWLKPGIRRKLTPYKNGMKDGACYKWHYYDEKQLEELNTYRNDVRHGEWKRWSSDGRLEGSGGMIEGNGIIKTYYKNMKLKLIEQYKNDRRDGPYVEYYDNGIIYDYVYYKNGKITGVAMSNEKDSRIRSYGTFNDSGKLDGLAFSREQKLIDDKITTVSFTIALYKDGTKEWEDENWAETTILHDALKHYQGKAVEDVLNSLLRPQDYKTYDTQR